MASFGGGLNSLVESLGNFASAYCGAARRLHSSGTPSQEDSCCCAGRCKEGPFLALSASYGARRAGTTSAD